MIRLRLSQILVNEEYKQGKFKIPVHLALGHEAIAVAVHHAMGDGDKLILSHRNIAYNLARLGSLRAVLDEYFLKPSGLFVMFQANFITAIFLLLCAVRTKFLAISIIIKGDFSRMTDFLRFSCFKLNL